MLIYESQLTDIEDHVMYRMLRLLGAASGNSAPANHSESGENVPNRDRRAVVLGVAAGGIAASSASTSITSPGTSGDPEDHRSVRYAETDHIRQAYRRMRF
jgi:hypothetical protein